VLTDEEYQIVMDLERPREERLAAFNSRAAWTRGLTGSAVQAMMKMVEHFADMGVVEARPGIPNDPDIPAIIYVESIPARRIAALAQQVLRAGKPAAPTPAEIAGWESEEQMAEFTSIRIRFKR
jgi:hypothetical protein